MAFKLTARRRFAAGVALVLLAVAMLWFALRANQATEQYLITQSNLPSGTLLANAGLGTVAVQLNEAQGAYLKELPIGAVLKRPLSAGKLLEADSVALISDAQMLSVVLTPATPLATTIKPGSSVDIWLSPKLENGFAPAFVLVAGAEVSKIREPDAMFASSNDSVELRVPKDSMGVVLDAISAAGNISIIKTD